MTTIQKEFFSVTEQIYGIVDGAHRVQVVQTFVKLRDIFVAYLFSNFFPRVIFTKRYAVDKDAPASQYSYARTSVKYTEEILRKHNQWMIRYYCTHRCLCF